MSVRLPCTTIVSHSPHSRATEAATQRAVQSAEADADSSASSTDMPGVVDSDVDLSSSPRSPTLPDRVAKDSMASTAEMVGLAALYVCSHQTKPSTLKTSTVTATTPP